MSEAQITDWLASQRQAMIDLLRDVVDIDSGSYDKEGVDAVGARFERHFSEHGIPFRREGHGTFGDAIHAEVAKPGNRPANRLAPTASVVSVLFIVAFPEWPAEARYFFGTRTIHGCEGRRN